MYNTEVDDVGVAHDYLNDFDSNLLEYDDSLNSIFDSVEKKKRKRN